NVVADRFNCSGKIRSRDRIFWFAKSEDESADTAFQHSAVVKSEGNGTNAHEKLIFVRNRLFDLFKFENAIRRTVFAISDRFHPLRAGRNFATAVICRSPIGELEPREERQEKRECAPF